MKARVAKFLNIRTGSPEVLPNNNPGFFKPGEVITVTEKVMGQNVKGNNIWYKLEDGGFVWSGGISSMEANEPPKPVISPDDMTPDKTCYDFIKKWEGIKLKAYTDSAGIWTIGYGTIMYEDGTPVKENDVITLEQAEQLLEWEVNLKTRGVNNVIKPVTLTQNQYNALVSFAYNTGSAALRDSTLLKRIKANPADATIRGAFMMWNKARVKGVLQEVPGLTNRRKEEADLYFT
jgi:lysozyme